VAFYGRKKEKGKKLNWGKKGKMPNLKEGNKFSCVGLH